MISKDTLEELENTYDIREMIRNEKYSRDYLKGIQDVLSTLKVIFNNQYKEGTEGTTSVIKPSNPVDYLWVEREVDN